MRRMTDESPEQISPNDRDPDSWAVFMREAQEGDRAAYRRLLVAITPYTRAMASRFLRGTPQDVEDAVQDILMTLHAIRHTYDPARPFKPWLAGIARHRLLERLRGRGKIGVREIQLGPEHETFAAVDPNGDGHALDVGAMQAAVRALPAGQRQAIELLKLREMSLKEASAMSGLSVAALKVATHRGLLALRRMLNGGGLA